MKQDNIFVGPFSKQNMENLLGKEGSAKLWDALSDFDVKKYKTEPKEMTESRWRFRIGRHVHLAKCLREKNVGDFDVWTRMFKHLMVLIDCRKHFLDTERSYIDNDMDSLYKTYYGKISRLK